MKFHRGNSIKSNMPVKWRGGKGKLGGKKGSHADG